MSIHEIFVKSNMMEYMSDDENLHKYYFLCKNDEFENKRKMIIRKKCAHNLYYLFEEYIDLSNSELYDIFSNITKYLNELINICFQNSVYDTNIRSFDLKDKYLQTNNIFYLKLKNNQKIVKKDFYIKKQISKYDSIKCNNHFYWTYRIKHIVPKLLLKKPEYLQVRALIY